MTQRPFVGAIMLLFVLFQGGSALAAEKVRIGIPQKASPLYALPMMAAQEMQLEEKSRIEMEWFAFRSGPDMYAALTAGSINMVLQDLISHILATARGIRATAVADLGAAQDFYFYVLSGSRIKEPRDLAGSRIGLTRLGSLTHSYGLVVIKALGLEKEAKFLAVGGSAEQWASLRTASSDVIISVREVAAPLLSRGALRELLVVKDYLPKEWPGLVIIARNDLISNEPDTVKRAMKVVFQATNFVLQNPKWALEKLVSQLKYDEQAAQLAYKTVQYGGSAKLKRESVEAAAQFLIEYGMITRDKMPSLDSLYTNKLLE